MKKVFGLVYEAPAYLQAGASIIGQTVMGEDVRIEARSLNIEARASSVQKRDSIRASTTIIGLSPLLASLP